MRVFLTGATGYIGSAVASALLGAGHHVVGLARSKERAALLRDRGIDAFEGDLADAERLAEGIRRTEAVIHTAAMRGPAMAELEIAAVRTMLEGIAGSGKRFVYTGAAFVYGDTGEAVVDEDARLSPQSIVRWRQGVERDVIDAAQHGVHSVVIRIPLVYGRGGSFIIPRLLQAAREEGVARYVGTGENRWSTVHVDDLADLFVSALHHAPPGSVFNAAAGEPITLRALAESIARAAGVGKTASWSVEEARRLFGPYAAGFVENQRLSSRRARDVLRWDPWRPGVLDDVERGSYRAAIAEPKSS